MEGRVERKKKGRTGQRRPETGRERRKEGREGETGEVKVDGKKTGRVNEWRRDDGMMGERWMDEWMDGHRNELIPSAPTPEFRPGGR